MTALKDPACFGLTHLFYPPLQGGPDPAGKPPPYEAAQEVCRTCPHTGTIGACRDLWESSGRPLDGVWFGHTPEQLKSVKIRKGRYKSERIPDEVRDKARHLIELGRSQRNVADELGITARSVRNFLKETA